MIMIIIKKWYGRLGNNIKQVITALYLAYHTNDNIMMPKHPLFNTTRINITKNNS